MKKISFLLLTAAFIFAPFVRAQENPDIAPYSFTHTLEGDIPSVTMPASDFTQDISDAEAFEKMGNYPRFARTFDLNLNPLNSGTWTELDNGDRLWRLSLKSTSALAISLFFDNFFLPKGATLHAYSPDHKHINGSYTHLDNQGNELFSTEFIKGQESILEYFEPAAVKGQGKFKITSLAHQYRELAMADDCQVNVNCTPEGDNWQDEKKGVVRIQVKEGNQIGYCSGSLVNNTALDCKRFILTAFHCGENCTTTDFNGWKFYFNYEASTCAGSDGTGTINNVFTGCSKKASSNDQGGAAGSDFLLIQMTSTTSPTWWPNVYFNGWNKSATAPGSGSICIHHPSGSNKKISKTTGTATSSSWGGQVASTHWRVHWTGTTNGWGVTEGGSSGSPLFNTSGLIVGTLTGGSSYCNSVQSGGQNQPDSYGKMSFHWTSNGTITGEQLKPWLDPINSGVTSLNGSYSPCIVGINEKAKGESHLTVYPNPNTGTFSVSVELEQATDIEITLYNYTGSKIETVKMPNTLNTDYRFDLSNRAQGVYFVHLNTPYSTEVKTIVVSGK